MTSANQLPYHHFKPGGFHPAHIGDEYNSGRYVIKALHSWEYGGPVDPNASITYIAKDKQSVHPNVSHDHSTNHRTGSQSLFASAYPLFKLLRIK